MADVNLQHEITAQAAELRQEVKSESAKLQQQLGDVREQVSNELAAVDQSIQKINNTMSEFHKNPAGRYYIVNTAHFMTSIHKPTLTQVPDPSKRPVTCKCILLILA